MTLDKTALIRALNDTLRVQRTGGRFLMTAGVADLGVCAMEFILATIARQTDFGEDDDPFHEHDFGCVTFNGEKLFWKIDYYNSNLTGGSEAPWDPSQCTRVMTIMLAEEY